MEEVYPVMGLAQCTFEEGNEDRVLLQHHFSIKFKSYSSKMKQIIFKLKTNCNVDEAFLMRVAHLLCPLR